MLPLQLASSDPLEGLSCLTLSPLCHQKGADGRTPCLDPFGFLWNTKLQLDLQCRVLAGLPYEDLFRFKCVSKQVKGFLDSNPFQGLSVELGTESVTLTTPYFYIASDRTWQCVGFDTSLNRWRRLPPLTYLPKPELELFKEYLVCAKGGLVCVNVSKSLHKERLIIFNPLTQMCRVLPPLNRRRNPVLMHMIVDSVTRSFQVVVAGSNAMAGDEQHDFSKVTEVFDSCTSQWRVTGDLPLGSTSCMPGPEYALNEFQAGVYQDGNILCIAKFLEAEQKGILVYNVEQGRWLENWVTPLPPSMSTNSTILQLVECSGEVYLFSEEEIGNGWVEHGVDRVEFTQLKAGEPVSWALTNAYRSKKTRGGRGLLVYPEFTCVAYAESQLCIFSTVSHTGMIYDVHDDGHTHQTQVLQPPPEAWSGACFYSLNPLSFPLELSFTSQVNPCPGRPL